MSWDPISILEVVAAVLIVGAGVWLYRRRPAPGDNGPESEDGGNYGSQGAVILFVVAVIIAIHGLGGMKYRPSASEIEMYQGLKGISH